MTVKKILVRAPNWIGDAVMALPAVEALKALFPEAELTVLTKGRALPVFENNPDIAGLVEYENEKRHRGVKGRILLARELKKQRYDMAVLLQNAFDAALIAYLAGIPERVGYARDLRSGLLTRAIPVTVEIKKVHQVYYYLNIIKSLGSVDDSASAPKMYPSPVEERWVESFLKENGLAGVPLSGASPGASYGPAKRWTPEGFAGALTRISEDYGAVPLIFGGPEDRDEARALSKLLKVRHIDLAGRITLRQFIALIARLRIFITNDSGPMHIAAAVGTPLVAIFGSTDRVATGPFSAHAVVVGKEIECSPCMKRECEHGHYRCLREISADDVYAAAASLLEKEAVKR